MPAIDNTLSLIGAVAALQAIGIGLWSALLADAVICTFSFDFAGCADAAIGFVDGDAFAGVRGASIFVFAYL